MRTVEAFLGWAVTCFEHVSVVPSDGSVADVLVSVDGSRTSVRCVDGTVHEVDGGDDDEVLQRLRSVVELFAAERAPAHVSLHAAVVVRDGRALLFPGPSRSGKSTIARAAVQLGAEYFSDDLAPIAADGFIEAFPRPLGVRGSASTRLESVPGVGVLGRRARPGAVYLARHEQGARWTPQRLSPGEAALRLAEHCIPIRRNPARSLEALARLASEVPVYEGVRGDVDLFVAELFG